MHMRPISLVLIAAAPLAAQTPQRNYTAQDYARAERFLGTTTAPLVTGLGVQPTWVSDGRFWYRTSSTGGFQFVMVDPARRTRTSAFDQARLAAALGAVHKGGMDPSRLPFPAFELAKNGRQIVVQVQSRRFRCDIQAYQSASVDTTAAAVSTPPANSVVSPDGMRAAFIREYNLWVKDLASGRETRLTTDGVKDFGYATNNAGWVRSPQPVVAWSPDSKKIATFQHDERGTSMMYLVSTSVGEPRLQAWHYPLPGDSVIFRIQRVIVDIDAPSGPRVVRFQMQ